MTQDNVAAVPGDIARCQPKHDLMRPYDDALQEILEHGVSRTNKRTGIRTRSIFGMCRRYRLDTEYFPILTRRKVWPKAVFAELLWFLSGSTRNQDLQKLGCNFWTPWVDHDFEKRNGYAEGAFGPVYGFQLRYFGGHYGDGAGGPSEKTRQLAATAGCEDDLDGFQYKYGAGGHDQLAWVVNRIKEDHSCRRTLWTLWNPAEISQQKLPPCHMLYQVLVDDDRRLTGIMYQRSADTPVGVCANVQFYSALTVMLAQQTDCSPHEFVHMLGDAHIYENQVSAVKQYLALPERPSPRLTIKKAKDIFSYTMDAFVLDGFDPGPRLEIPVAV